jgi:hypothetical protein
MISKQSFLPLIGPFASFKRKAESDLQKNCSPPSKLPRIESEKSPSYSEDPDSQEFNTFQYWKNPLPDITLELNLLTQADHMVCE